MDLFADLPPPKATPEKKASTSTEVKIQRTTSSQDDSSATIAKSSRPLFVPSRKRTQSEQLSSHSHSADHPLAKRPFRMHSHNYHWIFSVNCHFSSHEIRFRFFGNFKFGRSVKQLIILIVLLGLHYCTSTCTCTCYLVYLNSIWFRWIGDFTCSFICLCTARGTSRNGRCSHNLRRCFTFTLLDASICVHLPLSFSNA